MKDNQVKQYQQYSPLFRTVYDETQPVGRIGDGSHYSILEFRHIHNAPYDVLHSTDIYLRSVCVIWDQDHDTRIISLLEELYQYQEIYPILFIGESKGVVHIILDIEWWPTDSQGFDSFDVYKAGIENICDERPCGDSWHLDIVSFDNCRKSFIACSQSEESEVYLYNIFNLWKHKLCTAKFEVISRSEGN